MSETLSATDAPLMPATSGSFVGVSRQHHGDDLGLAAEAFGEQRPDGPIDLAAGQDFALAGPPFALDEAARNASGGIGVFAVIDGEGEEVDALAGVGIGAGGGENNVVADAHNAGAMCLLGQFSGFKVNGLAAVQLNCNFMFHCVQCSFRSERNRFGPRLTAGR